MQLRNSQKLKKGEGGFKEYPEKPVLSSSAEEAVITQNKAKNGKRRAEEQESRNSKLFSLLTEMREEMKMRDERFKEELRWRYEN